MFESSSSRIITSVNRGTNFGTHQLETEIIHRTPPSEEGWCFFQGQFSWWDGKKGIALALIFGNKKNFAQLLGRGEGYKALSKFKIPNFNQLNEIHCEDETGLLDRCWLISNPQIVEGLVLQVALHHAWQHLYLLPPQGKILGVTNSQLSLESVRTDPQVFESLVDSILGKT